MEKQCYPFSLPPLPYPADALAPHIDAETILLHHDRYLAGYLERLNRLLAPCSRLHGMTLCDLLRYNHRLPYALQVETARQAGGAYNHIRYFEGLSPDGGKPEGRLLCRIRQQFGGMEGLKDRLFTCAMGIFGSGYAMLCSDGAGVLSVLPFRNQQTPIPLGVTELVTVDVWEHAYFPQWQNRRDLYLEHWWQVINWEAANRRYACLIGD